MEEKPKLKPEYDCYVPGELPPLSPEAQALVEETLAADVPSDDLERVLVRCFSVMESMDGPRAVSFWVSLHRRGVDDFERCKAIHRHLAVPLLGKFF